MSTDHGFIWYFRIFKGFSCWLLSTLYWTCEVLIQVFKYIEPWALFFEEQEQILKMGFQDLYRRGEHWYVLVLVICTRINVLMELTRLMLYCFCVFLFYEQNINWKSKTSYWFQYFLHTDSNILSSVFMQHVLVIPIHSLFSWQVFMLLHYVFFITFFFNILFFPNISSFNVPFMSYCLYVSVLLLFMILNSHQMSPNFLVRSCVCKVGMQVFQWKNDINLFMWFIRCYLYL